MKLSVYLFRESVTDFENVLQAKYLDGDWAFRELKSTGKLRFPCRAYIQKNKAKKPNWIGFLSGHFKVSALNLVNQTNSFVLLVRASERIFAITFGYGFQALDRAKIEPRFGLIVAANCLKEKELCTVESNEVDLLTKHKQVHISKGSNVSEFDLNPHMDWIRKLSGMLHGSELATSVTGSDSVCIGATCSLKEVGGKCTKLLTLFKSKAYKKDLDIIDHLQPLGKHDPVVKKLDRLLNKRLGKQSHSRMSLAFPEIPDSESLDHYKISGNHSSAALQDLSLDGIYQFMEEKDVPPNAEGVHIVGIGTNDEPVTKRRSLREYLVAEFDVNGETYMFCQGDWFRAETDYVEKIRNEVAQLSDVTDELGLMPIRNNESETKYNQRAAEVNDLLLMDRATFKIGSSYDKIEVCDILSKNADMICVKKMDESSSMSHLFGQGSVSATLLRGEPTYLANLNKVAVDEWHAFKKVDKDRLNRVRVVYGIVTRKDEPLAKSMFFFSLVNLLNHVKTIRMVGCEVALCKIGYEEPAPAPTLIKRKKRKSNSMGSPVHVLRPVS